ncbi:MAG: hypothetical protein FJ044_02165 [Candidatus Cloacimonetes bacterium]|nr:hypothetical protein [Candidatus Cloacimonadota bacterium]
MIKYAGVILVTVEPSEPPKVPAVAVQLREIFGFDDKVRIAGDRIAIWTDWMCLQALMDFVEQVSGLPAVVNTEVLISMNEENG